MRSEGRSEYKLRCYSHHLCADASAFRQPGADECPKNPPWAALSGFRFCLPEARRVTDYKRTHLRTTQISVAVYTVNADTGRLTSVEFETGGAST